ncbi:MAG: DUF4330 family protein [Halodesulfurarchaeum sp.]
MPILDDQGRIFGVVNVIDALVVLLVLAVAVAGVALLTGSGGTQPQPDTETRYATVNIGSAPDFIANAVSVGDEMTAKGGTLTITDILRTAAGENAQHMVARVKITGPSAGDAVTFNGKPLRLNRGITISTARYQVAGPIVDVGTKRSSLLVNRSTRFVTVEVGSVADSVARELTRGDVLNSRRGAVRITDVYSAPTGRSSQFVVLRTRVNRTVVHEPGISLGPHVAVGRSMTLRGEDVEVSGTITAVTQATAASGEGSIERLSTRSIPVVLETTVSELTATRLSTGRSIADGGTVRTTIESIDGYPTEGDQTHLIIGATVTALKSGGQPTFAGRVIDEGTSLPVWTRTTMLSPQVTTVGSTSLPGDEDTTTVVIGIRNVGPWVARSLYPGMTETVRETAIARVTGVRISPAEITITNDSTGRVRVLEHPTRKDVELTVELQTRETSYGTFFHGRELKINRRIDLSFDRVQVSGRVKSISG